MSDEADNGASQLARYLPADFSTRSDSGNSVKRSTPEATPFFADTRLDARPVHATHPSAVCPSSTMVVADYAA